MKQRKRTIHTHWGKRNIMAIDIVVMLFLVLSVIGIFLGYRERQRLSVESIKDSTLRTETISNGDGLTKNTTSGNSLTLSSSSKNRVGVMPNATNTEDVSFAGGLFELTSSDGRGSSTVRESLFNDASSTKEFIRFKDVTATRYENSRLAFVMELPESWRLFYEHSNEVFFVNEAVTSGSGIDDVRRQPNAMWISISRECESADATSTSFALFNSSTSPTKERYVCIPPLKINVGTRSDIPNALERQSFLLDIIRTIYPFAR